MKVFFFDLDNCLYTRSHNIHELMAERIWAYSERHLSLSADDARELCETYYKQYGLALEGLILHHQIDPMEYNQQVDESLPLEKILHKDERLRNFLLSIDHTKIKTWIFTNSYKSHAYRVLKILGIDDLFQGVTFCDYRDFPLVCKPKKEMFAKAMAEAGATSLDDCYFVDDSLGNIHAAVSFGWLKSIHLNEDNTGSDTNYSIQNLYQLPHLFPEVFTID